MVIDQVLDDVAPPRDRRGRRRFAAVLVAFVAACCVMLVPSTQDAAQAFTIPPVITAIGDVGAVPASLVEATPAGFAITALAVVGVLAYQHRAQIAQFASSAICWLTNCHADHSVDVTQGKFTEAHPTSPADRVNWTLHCGATSCTASSQCTDIILQDATHPDYCASAGTSPGTGGLISVCTAGVGAGSGAPAVLVGRTGNGVSGGVGSYVDPTTNTSYPVPTPVKWINDGTSFHVCPTGYGLARAEWYNTATTNSLDLQHGWYFGGGNIPYDQQNTITCKRPDGTTYNVSSVIRTDPGDGSVGADVPNCAAGDVATSMDVATRITGDQSTAWKHNAMALTAAPDQVSNFGDCLNTDGTDNGTCHVKVTVNGTDCAVGVDVCWDWQSYEAAHPGSTKCMYGPHSMPLSDCAALAPAYRTGYAGTNNGGQGWYAANPDGSPSTATQPGSGSTSSPAPATGTTTAHDPAFDPQPAPAGDSQGCWSGMVSWNPLDWVYTPVKCVLSWAFVPPDGDFAAQMQQVGTTWSGTDVGKWFDGFGTLITDTAPPGDSSCQGPAWSGTLPAGGGPFTLHPFDACSDPEATVALIVKTGLTVIVWIGAGVVCMRLIGSAIGLNLNGIGGGGAEDS